MNKYHLQFFWTLLGSAILGVLIKLAIDGAIVAIVILAIVGALVLVGFGVVITLIAGNFAAKRDQINFMANAKENLSLMQAMQRLMNTQNSQLLKQVRRKNQLSAPSDDVVDLVEVDESIFDLLEE